MPHFWKHFPKIEIAPSLDDDGDQIEYIRKGVKWNQILEKREIFRRETPHVDIRVAVTVGLMNLKSVVAKMNLPKEKIFFRRSLERPLG